MNGQQPAFVSLRRGGVSAFPKQIIFEMHDDLNSDGVAGRKWFMRRMTR
ncbi:hypothetical protein GM418_05820 [Maribellus comscasis]|uniref:Uncharacterized protein n=1 Tax=Maribellus comscasis TaxID=2681766 RepID=A0A6I6JUX7_9BACT|nr:hypothetical protein [Maribellus comscasis]QGY43193.1 hypothetical protein GM418_05820 [Maribellus comscasis]